MGDSEVVGVRPQRITFTRGTENIACISLTERGLFRWYARCCNTAVGNTPRNRKSAHLGFIHLLVKDGSKELEKALGLVQIRVDINSAKEQVQPTKGAPKFIAGHIGSMLRE